jgi:hypothetical protein
MFSLINASGKYWRMDYRFAGKRKTLALGVYPLVSLAKARQRRESARELLADGIDPNAAKSQDKQARAAAAVNTFEAVAREWLAKIASERASATQSKISTWLEKDVIPFIGRMPISAIGPRDVLAALRKMEARGALDSVQPVKQICGQVFRYAVATGSAERDVTPDLKGALTKSTRGNFAAITEPNKSGELMRSLRLTAVRRRANTLASPSSSILLSASLCWRFTTTPGHPHGHPEYWAQERQDGLDCGPIEGMRVFGGLDLSIVNDLTALAMAVGHAKRG